MTIKYPSKKRNWWKLFSQKEYTLESIQPRERPVTHSTDMALEGTHPADSVLTEIHPTQGTDADPMRSDKSLKGTHSVGSIWMEILPVFLASLPMSHGKGKHHGEKAFDLGSRALIFVLPQIDRFSVNWRLSASDKFFPKRSKLLFRMYAHCAMMNLL